MNEALPNGKIVFRASRMMMALTTLGSAGFVAAGIWILTRPHADVLARVYGAAAILFFGLCFFVAARELLSPSARLELNREGVHASQPLGSTSFFLPWAEVTAVRLVTLSRQPIIVFDTADPAKGLSSYGPLARSLGKANLSLVGSWRVISPRTYGVSTEELCAAIDRARQSKGTL